MKKNSKHKILLEVSENTDDFSWNELNCFYRPWAIIYQAIDSEYSDLFLFDTIFYHSFLTGEVFSKGKKYYLAEDKYFLEFSNNYLDKKYGVETDMVYYKGYDEFIDKIIDIIDEDAFTIIPADLLELNYYTEYKDKSFSHFFVVKGYDYDKKIFYILDNMHIDGGASTIYKDFVIDFEKLYELNQLFFKNLYKNKKAYIWRLKNIDKEKSSINLKYILLEHSKTLEKMNNNTINYAKDLLNITTSNNCDDVDILNKLFSIYNSQTVYYKILYKYIARFISDKEELQKIEEDFTSNISSWNKIMVMIFYQFQKGTKKYNKYYDKVKDQMTKDKILRNTIINIIQRISKIKDYENEEYGFLSQGSILNNHKAELSIKDGKFNIIHSNLKTYDTWLSQDNAVQMLFLPKDTKTVLTTKVAIEGDVGQSFHSGIIIKFADGSKILFGMYKKMQIAAFMPELNEKNVLFEENYTKDSVYIKIEIDNSKCDFYIKEDKELQWRMLFSKNNEKKIKKIGMFSKTWEKCNVKTTFEDAYLNI